jgi:hypothetical protein
MLPWSLVGLALVWLEKMDGLCDLAMFLMKNSYEQLLLSLCFLLNEVWLIDVASPAGSAYL